jgi:hypothetical protein
MGKLQRTRGSGSQEAGEHEMKPLAFKIQGELENQSELHIATNNTYTERGSQIKESDMYPLGQNLRGAFGYLFLEMKSKIADTLKNGHPVIYFKDALIKHHDGTFIPVVYECSECLHIDKYPAIRQPMAGISLGSGGTVKNMYMTDVVSGKNRFRFEAIFNMKAKNVEEETLNEEYLAEFICALKYVEDNGLYLGRRNSKGLGKVLLKKLKILPITMDDIKKRAKIISQIVRDEDGKMWIHLFSDTISSFPLSGEDIVRDAKNAAKFFDPDFAQYKDPKIIHIEKPVELPVNLSFLDLKIKTGKPRFEAPKSVISRGTRFRYQVTDAVPEFFNALAMAEILRGIGDRTSFGKGEFVVS